MVIGFFLLIDQNVGHSINSNSIGIGKEEEQEERKLNEDRAFVWFQVMSDAVPMNG